MVLVLALLFWSWSYEFGLAYIIAQYQEQVDVCNSVYDMHRLPKKPFDKNNPIIGKATWEIITARKTPCIYSAAPAPEIFSSENYSWLQGNMNMHFKVEIDLNYEAQ